MIQGVFKMFYKPYTLFLRHVTFVLTIPQSYRLNASRFQGNGYQIPDVIMWIGDLNL